MCLREEENGTNWSQCCISVCEACLLHNLISHSYNSHSRAVISPGYPINKCRITITLIYSRILCHKNIAKGTQCLPAPVSLWKLSLELWLYGIRELVWARLVLVVISANYKVLHDLLQVSQEERAAWEEHPECGAWPVIWEDKIRKSWHHWT